MENVRIIFDLHIDKLPTIYSWKDKFRSLAIGLVAIPIQFTLGLVQTIVLTLLLVIRGPFYKSGIKGYFIDNIVLLKDDYKYQKAKAKYKNKYTFIKINDFEAIKLEHKGQNKQWVIYIPGMTSNLIGSLETLENIHNAGYNVICLNNSGIGDSKSLNQKAHTIDTLAEPIIKAYYHLKDQNPIFWGHSMGGAIAAVAASKINTPIGIIIDRSFNRLTDAAKYGPKYFFFPFNRLIAFISNRTIPFDTEQILQRLQGSVITISHDKDEMIRTKASTRQISNSGKVHSIVLKNSDYFKEKRKNTPAPNHISLYTAALIKYLIDRLVNRPT